MDFLIGNIIVEIDGASHYEAYQVVYDEERTRYLEGRGYRVVRVRNEHVVSFDMNRLRGKRKQNNTGVSRWREPKNLTEEEQKALVKMKKSQARKVVKKPGGTIQITRSAEPPTQKTKIRFSYAELRKGA